MIHPATLLLLWGGLLISLQSLALPWLAVATSVTLLGALFLVRARCWLMLRRMRWLLLTTSVLFVWATPGEYVSGLPGISYEGLLMAAHQLLCLLLFVGLLCLLLARLGNQRLIVALHALLWPLTFLGLNRDRAALRLLLVMDYLDQPPPAAGWRAWLNQDKFEETGAPSVSLPQASFTWRDGVLLGALLMGFAAMVWWR